MMKLTMKKMWSLAALMVVMLTAAMTLTACDDDDDEDEPGGEVSNSAIVGTWKSAVYEDDGDRFQSEVTFKSNGTYEMSSYDIPKTGEIQMRGSYTYKGNKLTISSNSEWRYWEEDHGWTSWIKGTSDDEGDELFEWVGGEVECTISGKTMTWRGYDEWSETYETMTFTKQ